MDIKKIIEKLELEKIKVSSVEEKEDHSIITIEGGLNGNGGFDYYLGQVRILEQELNSLYSEVWLISWINDCLDDIWTLKIGIRK